MSTDDFTAAARAEAERRWSPRESDRLPMDWLDEGMGSGFVLGALWARTHLTAQEPTAAEHRIARLEAQTDIRGRAVAIYQRRAREAEAERDWNWRSSRHSKIERIKANARADRAEAERDMLLDDLRKAEQRADQAEARVRHLEDTARVLVKDMLAATDARDEHRRRADEAEAEARTQRHRADDMEDNALRAQTNRQAAEERVDEWARDHLAAQEPTDAECIAFWHAFEDAADETNIENIRAALSAARAARRDEEDKP